MSFERKLSLPASSESDGQEVVLQEVEQVLGKSSLKRERERLLDQWRAAKRNQFQGHRPNLTSLSGRIGQKAREASGEKVVLAERVRRRGKGSVNLEMATL